jgi:hypothetical protein
MYMIYKDLRNAREREHAEKQRGMYLEFSEIAEAKSGALELGSSL